MDLSANTGKLPTTTGGHDFPNDTNSGILSLHVLEFKTSLLEAVEELHIHREAESRHEQQISALVLEKQELEWQKESLQHQINTMADQHKEDLADARHKMQLKIRGIEGEKGKHQLTAELKEKEINSLKEELKLLQLFKYSLEKKLSELEQKVQLQIQTKDSHLNQLGEVEKRFGALSRQYATVKLAHEKLEQNVEEAMRLNKKLTSVNRTQQSTIISLKRDVQELNNKLVKAKVSSLVRSEEICALAVKEQHIHQLQHRLNVETEMNKKLREHHTTEKAEKREVMSSLQHAQQLVFTLTQTGSRLELELQGQREEYQSLKREHELTIERTQDKEKQFSHLMEENRKSRMIWENEKQMLLERVQGECRELRCVKQVNERLDEKHTVLSSCAVMKAENKLGPQTGLKVHCKDQHSPGGESRAQSPNSEVVSEAILTEDTFIGDIEAQTVANDCRQWSISVTDMSDLMKDDGQVGSLETVISSLPQPTCYEAVDGLQTTHGSNSVPECNDVQGAAENQHGDDSSSTVLQKTAGHLEGLDPIQCEPADGPTTLTEQVPLAQYVCGAEEDQPADSNIKADSTKSVFTLIDNVCWSSEDNSSKKCESVSVLSGSRNSFVYDAIDGDSVAEGTRDAGRDQSVCTPETTTKQTSDKHRVSKNSTSSIQDIDPGQAGAPLSVSGPCYTLPQEVFEIRRGKAEETEVIILSDESPSISSATVQMNSNTHFENWTEPEVAGAPRNLLQPLTLLQPNCPQSIVAQDFAQSDSNIGIKELQDKHEQASGDCVLETVEVLELNCQENSSGSAKTHGDVPERHCPGENVDHSCTPGPPFQYLIAVNLKQSGSVREGHCAKATVDDLITIHTNKKDASLTQNKNIPLASERQGDEMDFSNKISNSRQCDKLDSEKTSEIIDFIDCSFLASNKKYRSSFELTTKGREILSKNMQDIAACPSTHGIQPMTPTCQSSPVCELKNKLSSELHDSTPPFQMPVYLKGKPKPRDVSVVTGPVDILTSHKRHHQEEWNISETCHEASAGNVHVGAALPHISTPSVGTSTLKQSYPQTVSCAWLPSCSMPGTPGTFPHRSQDSELLQQSDIRDQIAKIEQLLDSKRLRFPKRYKIDVSNTM
ncbi:hypothetical protein UPYG_G00268610 [Umbra pygmaea]|uniref:Coiled-coil domain-containing protein 73 n=1 Tax=Umbra pygmaea TaxID=75934 RepID=A0ABD0WAE9_UMBPY